MRSPTIATYALAGAAAGLSFYVYPVALLALPVPILLLAFLGQAGPHNRRIYWGVWLSVLLATALPIVLQPEFWVTKVGGLWLNQPLLREAPMDAVRHMTDHVPVVATHAHDETEVLGINSPAQLAELERRYQRRIADALMEAGVRLADPSRIDVRGTLVCGQDVEIDVCVYEGRVELGDNVRIESHCVLRNLRIEDNAVVHSFTHADGEKAGARIGRGAEVGPFARLRPGADLGEDVHIGNLVEVKNSTLGRGAKANHLAYLGDATVGERVNYGAGNSAADPYPPAHRGE